MPLAGSFGAASSRSFGFTRSSTASVVLPVVTGGTLYSDATYYYRVFTANGTLTVSNAPITMSTLIVASGGGGASSLTGYSSGGGGAGQILSQNSISVSAISHSIIVGAGGPTNTNGNASGCTTVGSSIGLTTGGGGKGGNSTAGSSGGSGGGGGVSWMDLGGMWATDAQYTGGASNGTYTNAGGSGNNTTGYAGGGGGAGGAGSNAGTGGAGVNLSTFGAWVGLPSSFAGGGAGHRFDPTAYGTVSNGGGSNANGTANTGGGGSGNGFAGGSGFVAVRYLRSAVGG